jgi:flagellar biosynthesis protein FlhF
MRDALQKVRAALGDDAMILSSRSIQEVEGVSAEIVAAPASAVNAFNLAMSWSESRATGPEPDPRIGPRLVALVGPPGAGKTLTAVKLALSKHAFGGQDVGFLTLDTYRVGAVDELHTYAELMGVPVEVVYGRRELEGVMHRLRSCDTVLIDTPGRSPDAAGRLGPWEELLELLRPHEVHLVLPAGIRLDVAAHQRSTMEDLGVTHLLPSKLDQVPGDTGLAELVEQVGLPARWVADGHDVPTDLRPAGPRVLTAMGRDTHGSSGVAGWRAVS